MNGKWRVKVRAFYNAGGDVEFFIRGDTTDPIEYVEVGADNAGYSAQVYIDGASQEYDIPSIDEVRIEPQHNAGDAWIMKAFTSGKPREHHCQPG
ncbi:MAG: hypothetical protein IT437_04520 [Phycisphaerales bacterium]|nr:hypothetical protein [Phycisphaerales bacterium]